VEEKVESSEVSDEPAIMSAVEEKYNFNPEVDNSSAVIPPSGDSLNESSKQLFRVKKKRTVAAAVSAADRSAALTAMAELRRSRGATTPEDLVCRLCAPPPPPFTAYSTLLTHYRNAVEDGCVICRSLKSEFLNKLVYLLP
jgi:hypothetical protein